MPDRILKDISGIKRLVSVRIDALCKDQLAEYGVWIWRYYTFNLTFNGQWQLRGRGDCRRIRDRGS